MAFSLDYLQRVQASVDLNKISNPLEGQVTGQGPTMWLYNGVAAGDATATIAASGYFNGATGYLSQGDLIYANTTDSANTGAHFYNVTSATGAATVTVATTV